MDVDDQDESVAADKSPSPRNSDLEMEGIFPEVIQDHLVNEDVNVSDCTSVT